MQPKYCMKSRKENEMDKSEIIKMLRELLEETEKRHAEAVRERNDLMLHGIIGNVTGTLSAILNIDRIYNECKKGE